MKKPRCQLQQMVPRFHIGACFRGIPWMVAKKTLQLEPVIDLSPFVADGELVAMNVGPDDQVYAVIALNELDYRSEKRGASFAKTAPDAPRA